MKRSLLIILMAIAAVFYACSNDNNTPEQKGLDPNSVISVAIKQVQTPQSRALNKKDPRFITLYAWDYKCKWKEYDNSTKYITGTDSSSYYRERDAVNWKIRFMGWDVITERGEISEFPNCTNIVLRIALDVNRNPVKALNYTGTLDLGRDTIGYIPNEVMKRNLKQLTELFEAGRYEDCYAMFDTAYYFIPITGAEYRALVASGTEVRD